MLGLAPQSAAVVVLQIIKMIQTGKYQATFQGGICLEVIDLQKMRENTIDKVFLIEHEK